MKRGVRHGFGPNFKLVSDETTMTEIRMPNGVACCIAFYSCSVFDIHNEQPLLLSDANVVGPTGGVRRFGCRDGNEMIPLDEGKGRGDGGLADGDKTTKRKRRKKTSETRLRKCTVARNDAQKRNETSPI